MPSAPFLVRWGEVMTGRLPPGIGCLCLASLALLVVGVSSIGVGVPTDLRYTVSGARTIELSWNYSSSLGPPDGYRITLTTVQDTTMTYSTSQMSIVINGLVPFDYDSSIGVLFAAQVLAFASGSDGEPVSTGNIVVPPCPGRCNYRYYTSSNSSCASSQCICSSAYTGSNCSTPNFFPGSVSAVYNAAITQDEAQATVTWDIPKQITLDGRFITMFRVTIETAITSTLLHQANYIPNSSGSGQNSRVISGIPRSIASSQNLMVTVRTITDDSDFADSQPQAFATRVPGPVRNLSAVFVNATSFRVTWVPPFDDNGLVSMYQLLFQGIVNLDPELRLYNVIAMLAGNTTHSIIMRARNSLGLGVVATTSLTTPSIFCPANTYLSSNGTNCTNCFATSVSPPLSLDEFDCQCIPGHEPLFQTSDCIPCSTGQYQDVIGNTNCVACPFPLRTTASQGASTLDNCTVCRYTDGTYPADTCYYFNVTGSVTVMTISNGFNIFWSGVPATVQGYDKNARQLTSNYSVVSLNFNCVSTGRGVLPSGNSYNQTRTTTSLIPPEVHQGANLNGLVEYSCTISIGAQISSQLTAYGPTSNPALVLTQAFGSSMNALPQIRSVTYTSGLHIVNFELDSRLLPFVNSISVFHTSEGDPSNIRITTLPTATYSSATPSIGIQDIPTNQRTNFYLNSSIDNVIYISDKVDFDALTSQTTPSSSQSSISFSSTIPTTQTPIIPSTIPSEITNAVQSTDVLFSVSPTPSLPSSVLSNTMMSSAMTSTLSSSSTMTLTPFTTEVPTDPPGLQAPGGLMATLINENMARLSWQAVTGASGYKVTYQSTEVGSSPEIQDIIGDSVLELTITDLQPYSNYSFTIAAVDTRGVIGQMTEPQVLETPEALPSPPRNIIIVEEGGNILIQWERPEMPNGIITNYVVTVTSQSLSGTYEIESDINFVRVPKPSTQYSVTVQAVNGAGNSMEQGATLMATTEDLATTVDEPTGNSLSIPIVAGAGGGGLLFLCLVLILCLCCCYYYRCNNRRKHVILTGHAQSNKYIARDRPPMDVPVKGSTALSYYNPLADASLAQESILIQQTDFSASNLKSLEAGEEQYAEISQDQRLGAVERAAIVVPPKDATPADYNNEDLYMEMEKLYYTDMGGADTLESFEFSRSSIELLEEIGKGQFGRVMKARAKGIIARETTSIVAVKMLKDNADEKTRMDFFGEAQLLAKFGDHPNVMTLLKVVHTGDPALVITHYMPYGDLKHYLKKCNRDKNSPMGTLEQLNIAEQIACGMEYLARKFFIHRDLAARNVLVGEKNLVKISDFGLSRALSKEDSYYKVSQTSQLPVKWMALESLLYQKFSTYSDVWSFGVTMWEIFTFGDKPYKGIQAMHVADHIRQGHRLPCPTGCPEDIYSIMTDCWKIKKETRPTFTQLRTLLKARSIAYKRISTNSVSKNVNNGSESF